MLKLGKIRIHYSFFALLLLVAAFGWFKQFFLVIVAVTAHELTHIAAAKAFGLKVNGILISPLGETASISGFDGLPAIKKNVVLFAGPLFNIFSALIIYLFFLGHAGEFMYVSLAIGLFNLLPIYPMDGGRLLFVYLGNRFGILGGASVLKHAVKLGIVLLLAAGIIQLILFPLNISLLALGFFFASVFKREKSSMIISYYNCMHQKGTGLAVKTAAFSKESAASSVERIFTWDYFHIIHVIGENGEIIATLTEKQIFETSSRRAGEEIILLDIIENNDIIKSN